MASNKNNNALWKNIREIKKKAKIYNHWVDLLACETWKCKADKDGNNQPILNENGKLPESRIEKLEESLGSSESRIEKLEESLGSSDSDTGSVDSLDEDIQQLKDDINRLDARSLYYATEQQLDEVAQLGRDNQERLNIHGVEIADLEARADEVETDRDALIERIETLEDQLPRAHQPGGGKRRKKRTRKKRHKKKTKKRRKSTRKNKGGHAGNVSLPNSQPNYTELAAMLEADPHKVYYLYVINTNSAPPQVAPEHSAGFIHKFKLNTNGDKIAITGHKINHHNQHSAYTIPNPANNNIPSAIEVLNNFYNPGTEVSREFRDISDMMGNLQVGGRQKRRKKRRKKKTKKRRRKKKKKTNRRR